MRGIDARIKFYTTDSDSQEFCVMWSCAGYLSDAVKAAQPVVDAIVQGWYPSAVNLFLGNGKRHSGRVVFLSTVANCELATRDEIVEVFRKLFGEIEVSGAWR